MTREEFLQEQDNILSGLDAYRPKAGVPVSLLAVNKLVPKVQFLTFAGFSAFASGATAYAAHAGWLGTMAPGQVGKAAIVAALVGAVVYGILFDEDNTAAIGLHKKMVETWNALRGRDQAMSAEQAKEVAQWADRHPKIMDACVEWGAQNASKILTHGAHKHLARIVKRLDKLDAAWNEQTQERAALEAVSTNLNQGGLLDRVQARVQQVALENATPIEPSTAPRPRF